MEPSTIDKLTILHTRFPNLGLRLDVFPSNSPALQPSHHFVTNLLDVNGIEIVLRIDDPTTFDVDEVSLRLLSIVVHRARKERGKLEGCPCIGCVANRLRNYERCRMDPDPPQIDIERIDQHTQAGDDSS